jgi:hypothetical protein
MFIRNNKKLNNRLLLLTWSIISARSSYVFLLVNVSCVSGTAYGSCVARFSRDFKKYWKSWPYSVMETGHQKQKKYWKWRIYYKKKSLEELETKKLLKFNIRDNCHATFYLFQYKFIINKLINRILIKKSDHILTYNK